MKCDGDQECPNGSWLHPQCTSDLRDKSKKELDTIEEWYCEDCVARIQREEEDPNINNNMHNEAEEEEYEEENEDEEIDVHIDQEDIEMQEAVEALDQEIVNIDLDIIEGEQQDNLPHINPEELDQDIGNILLDRD